MTLAKELKNKCDTTWRETLWSALELEQPSLINLEWLLDRIERDERPSK